jgi:RHS repeat-associated protein
MAGISSKALNNAPENRYKYNGIEQNNDFDLNVYDAFYRNLDPQIGRFWQIDPKPNEMLSPYAAMANNPILYSDPLGDTTWVYGRNGALMGVVNDKMKNQVHFMDNDGKGTFDGSKLTAKQSKAMANAVRKTSIAFMGSKTANDMKSISDQSTAANKEIAFVGAVGKDREIRLTAMPIDENNFKDQVNIGSQLDKNYSKEQQSDFFLVGHVHQGNLIGPFYAGDRSPMGLHQQLGEPSNDDYSPMLYRSGSATERGQSPALITTPYGVTVYGTGTSSVPVPNRASIYPNRAIPTNDSYILYRRLKQ